MVKPIYISNLSAWCEAAGNRVSLFLLPLSTPINTFNIIEYNRKGITVQENLLDIIETETKRYVGVIDYVSTKHVTIFDMTNNDDPELSMAIIIYKMYFSSMRFSVYKAIYFAHYPMEEPIMVNKKNIKGCTNNLQTQKPNKKIFKYSNK